MDRIVPPYSSSPLVGDAFERAAEAHSSEDSKDLEHPVAVAHKLAENACPEELVAAALLHDTVEDDEASLGELRERFGPRVCALVDALTEDESIEPWERRKAVHRDHVRAAGPDAAAIYAADKLAGMGELRHEYAQRGEAAAERLSAPDLDTRIRVWEGDIEMLEKVEPRIPFLPELRAELGALKAARQAAQRGAETR